MIATRLGNKITPDIEERMRELYRQGNCDLDIALALGVHRHSVSQRLRSWGLPVLRLPSRIHKVGPCANCQDRKAHKAYGLCYACYRRPEVYARAVKLAGPHPDRSIVPLSPTSDASQPCLALPGSAAKLAELERRALAGEALWCKGDATGNE